MMGIVSVKNPDLYRDWISYLCKKEGCDGNPAIRTTAFFNSQKCKPVPMN